MNETHAGGQRTPSHLFVAGFNHARVPIRLRERYCLTVDGQRRLLSEIRHCPPVAELVVLNTCNRFELYVVSTRSTWSPAEQVGHILRMIWPEMERADFEELVRAAYWHEGDACARHLFRTSASLDSMVVGEAEVNGQVKAAYHLARELGATGPVLNRLFQNAFAAAKRVRTETEIARGFVSIGTVAVRAGLDAHGRLPRGILLVGAGQLATTIARHLRKEYDGPLRVANRTLAHAEALACEVGAEPVALEHLADALASVDLVLVAAGAPDHLITKRHFADGRTDASPVTLVDVCLPRTVDPDLRECAGVTVLDLDDLQQRVSEGEHRRRAGIQRAEELVQACVAADWPRLLFAMGRGERPEMRRRSAGVAVECAHPS